MNTEKEPSEMDQEALLLESRLSWPSWRLPGRATESELLHPILAGQMCLDSVYRGEYDTPHLIVSPEQPVGHGQDLTASVAPDGR